MKALSRGQGTHMGPRRARRSKGHSRPCKRQLRVVSNDTLTESTHQVLIRNMLPTRYRGAAMHLADAVERAIVGVVDPMVDLPLTMADAMIVMDILYFPEKTHPHLERYLASHEVEP